MHYIVEYRYKPGFREPLTEWKYHHKSDSEADALEEIRYLERTDRQDRAEGLMSWWEKTEYRVAEVMG